MCETMSIDELRIGDTDRVGERHVGDAEIEIAVGDTLQLSTGTSPSNGQPRLQIMLPKTVKPASCAIVVICAISSNVSSMERLPLARLCDSVTESMKLTC